MDINEFENFLEIHGKDIFNFSVKISFSIDEAEVIYQETLLKAFEKINMIKVNKNPKSYVIGIMLMIRKNYIRKKYRRNKILPLTEIDEIDIKDKDANVEESIIDNELNRLVNKLVMNLDDKHKIPIIMYYTMDMTLDEISLALKVPVGTIKSRLHYAKKSLRKELEEEL